jgi:hypothetical protein
MICICICVSQAPAVVVPKTQAQLQAAGTAACKQLGRQFVVASPQGLIWSITKTKCFNGVTTVASGLAWSELLCCPAGAPTALLLPPAGGLARRRDGRLRGSEGRLRATQRDSIDDFDRAYRGGLFP